MNVIKAFCDNAVARARALEEAGFQLTERWLVAQITPIRLIVLMTMFIYGEFLQARHDQLSSSICNLQMQVQDQQKPLTSPPTETFKGCMGRLGGR